MPESINWIHLSDLHLGLDSQSWFWPRVKHDFFGDVERLADEVGPWDIVFFTGDLTQAGSQAEFDQLNKELEELWAIFAKRGVAPLLCIVPGNHDVIRPAPGAAVVRALTRLWWSDDDLRSMFWQTSPNEYRDALQGFLQGYSKWCSQVSVPTIPATPGLLPGDFSAVFKKGTVSLGIVGLNSTFLQIVGGDFKGKLDLHVSQLNAVCDNDPVRWLAQQTAAVLMTHHPPSWLAPRALDHFRQEIYPPGRFLLHLCGHEHEPEASQLSEAGAEPRRLRQAPSLFGLKEWCGPEPKERTHGYTAGQLVFDSTGGLERMWPRIAIKGRHGGLNICPDHTYKLGEGDCVVTSLELDSHPTNEVAGAESPDANPTVVHGADGLTPEAQLFGESLDKDRAGARLATCPRLNLAFGPHHEFVRQEEQSQLELALRSGRCAWLVADWGAGKEGFLGASLKRFKRDDISVNAFHVRCEEASDIDALEALFPQQFGLSLQGFCHLAAPLKGSFLVLDELHPELCKEEQLQKLRRIIAAILDYCPDLCVVVICRLAQSTPAFSSIILRTLDAPDVRTYITHHPDATVELREPEVIEKLHARSDGLPMHLDRMLRALRVSSLNAVLDMGVDFDPEALGMLGATPIALVRAVSTLSRSRDKRSRRSFRLLKVLAVLPYGETLETLNHYLPTEPFFDENALQLNELALLEVVLSHQASIDLPVSARFGDTDSPKILRVPRQVRDYIQTILSEEERASILLAGMETFFGRRWREGTVQLRKMSNNYRQYLNSSIGNEFAVITQLLRGKTDDQNSPLHERVLNVAMYYVRYLRKADRFRDLLLVTSTFLQTVDEDRHVREWSELSGLYGVGLRMTGKSRDSLLYLRRALESDNAFSQADKAKLWINVAYAERTHHNADAAREAAETAKTLSKPKRSSYLEAEYIEATVTLKGDDLRFTLGELEKTARKEGSTTIAENILLELASSSPVDEKIVLLDKVLTSKTQDYNRVRAIVAKAKALQRADSPLSLRQSEIAQLASAYSYLHSQRLSALFDSCHDSLWRVFEANGDTEHLLRLFRHSSFVWRIRGDEKQETASLERLVQRQLISLETPQADEANFATRYFRLRLRALKDVLQLVLEGGEKS